MNHYKKAHASIYAPASEIVHDSSLKDSPSRDLLVKRLKVLHNMVTLGQYIPIKTNTNPIKPRYCIVQQHHPLQ